MRNKSIESSGPNGQHLQNQPVNSGSTPPPETYEAQIDQNIGTNDQGIELAAQQRGETPVERYVVKAITGIVPEFDPNVGPVTSMSLEERLTQPPKSKNPFEKYTNRGRSSQLLKRAMRKAGLFGKVGSTGEATVWYGKHGTGKTLIVLALLIQAIIDGKIDPSKVFYFNMDDSSQGVAEKVAILEEYGVHVIVPGEQGFKASLFRHELGALIDSDHANGTVIIADTLKKLVSLMDKSKASNFADQIRQFVMKGGTFLGLAHTNKHLGADGKPVYGGTSDIVDDFDRSYLLEIVSDGKKRVINFVCNKSRGGADESVAYEYDTDRDATYEERVLSVRHLETDEYDEIQATYKKRTDAEMINAIKQCIKDGSNTKMKLAAAAAAMTDASKRSALGVIERYTGSDPTVHHWNFDVRDRGANVFRLLESPE